ncbi:MAG: TIGR00730 family Rossman fold protein [Rubrobacteraceae bacterium]
MDSVCIFCGSSNGSHSDHAEAARSVGRLLAERGLQMVYGGGRVGLMGEAADAALEAGGEVIGVIPEDLRRKEISHTGLTKLHVVGSMHERKALMADLSDGFIALPGGYGTLEEFVEVLSWAQLSIHEKPCALLNVNGFYDSLSTFFDGAVEEGFVHPDHRSLVLMEKNPQMLLDRMACYTPPETKKWIDPRKL